MSLHDILKDKECAVNIQYFIIAVCIVFGGLCFLIYGLALLNHVNITSEDIYKRRDMADQIEDLYQWRAGMVMEYGRDQIEYENHTHIYNGKPKRND